MPWIILAIGIIVGGILRLIYYRKKSKAVLYPDRRKDHQVAFMCILAHKRDHDCGA